jgi:hypothetical protein
MHAARRIRRPWNEMDHDQELLKEIILANRTELREPIRSSWTKAPSRRSPLPAGGVLGNPTGALLLSARFLSPRRKAAWYGRPRSSGRPPTPRRRP